MIAMHMTFLLHSWSNMDSKWTVIISLRLHGELRSPMARADGPSVSILRWMHYLVSATLVDTISSQSQVLLSLVLLRRSLRRKILTGKSCCLVPLVSSLTLSGKPYFTVFVLAEEGGGGKIKLLEREAYEEMDACVMFVSLFLSKTMCAHNVIFWF